MHDCYCSSNTGFYVINQGDRYIYIYIYIERERERETGGDMKSTGEKRNAYRVLAV
jgi:hypothetical protein